MLLPGIVEVGFRFFDGRFRLFQTPVLRGGRHTDLYGAGEIVENLMPVGIIVRTAPVAFVDDDEVKEITGKLFIVVLFFSIIVAHQLLVQSQEDVLGGVDILVVDFFHGIHERIEILPHGLVDEDVPVCQVQDFFKGMGMPEAVNDLEGTEGLSRTRSHDEEEPFLPLFDIFNGPVDGDALVVPGPFAVQRGVVGLRIDFHHLVVETLFMAVPVPQVFLFRELHHFQVFIDPRDEVELDEIMAIGGIGKGHIQAPCIFLGLAVSFIGGMLGALGFHHGDGDILVEAEQIVRLFRLPPVGFIVFIDGNDPVSDGIFHMDIMAPAPFVLQHRCNQTELRGLFIFVGRPIIFFPVFHGFHTLSQYFDRLSHNGKS